MRAFLAVAGLLVTAGCAGFAPTVDVQPPEPADGYPPGVSADGVENATALLYAHTDAVRRSGYAFIGRTTKNVTHIADDDSLATNKSTTWNGQVTRNVTRVRTRVWHGATRKYDERAVSTELWFDESSGHRLLRTSKGDGTVAFDVTEDVDGLETAAVSSWTTDTLDLLGEGDYDLTRRYVEDGRTLVVLESDAPGSTTHDAFSARLVVDLAGRVHEFDARATGANEDHSWTETATYELTDLGVASVPKPEWHDTALSTPEANIVYTARERHLELEYARGDVLPPGTTVVVSHDDETTRVALDRELGPGDTLYVTDPADRGPVVSFDRPADDLPPMRGEYRVKVLGPDGYAVESVYPEVWNASA